jgi:nucleoside-diphosphate-sugar epimerase
MLKVLLLGSNGYIGNRFYKDYKFDYKFSLIDSCWHDDPLEQSTIQLNYKELSSSFIQDFDVVLLLAAHSSVPMCKGHFLDSYKNNVDNFVNLVSKLDKKQKFIYASSSSVYGFVDSPVSENHLCFETHENYDTQKIIIDLIASKTELKYYGLRFGTVNGYSPYTRDDIMLNSMTKSAIEKGEVNIFNPDTKRPILAVGDLSRAIAKIINTNSDKFGIYNLASFNSNVKELGLVVSDFFGVNLNDHGDNGNKIYDFAIDSTKFINDFDFTFEYDAVKIIEELKNKYNDIKWTSRKNSGTKY